jgi:predicted aminopeptidase
MWRASQILFVALILGALSGCALPYYWQAVGGQIDLMRRRIPIETAIEDPANDQATRSRLETVLELREFASNVLELPDNGSYSTFVNLGRDYVVWNVIAAEKLSVDPIQWCFPVAGCVSYRGYFDREDAERFEQQMSAEGYDTYSGGSGAYSTLGYFADPVLNTMIAGSDFDLARILFHELAHQRIYIKGDSELSEAFASAVEENGVERWLISRGDEVGLLQYRERRARARQFEVLVASQRTRLQALYASGESEAYLLQAKVDAYAAMERDYLELKRLWGGRGDYDGWFVGSMNNARLAAVSTYRQWLPGLSWRIEQIGLSAFFDEVEALEETSEDARRGTLEAWNAASTAGPLAQTR